MVFRVCFPSATGKRLVVMLHATVRLGQSFCGVRSSVTGFFSRKCDACDACGGDRRITSRAIPPWRFGRSKFEFFHKEFDVPGYVIFLRPNQMNFEMKSTKTIFETWKLNEWKNDHSFRTVRCRTTTAVETSTHWSERSLVDLAKSSLLGKCLYHVFVHHC